MTKESVGNASLIFFFLFKKRYQLGLLSLYIHINSRLSYKFCGAKKNSATFIICHINWSSFSYLLYLGKLKIHVIV